MDFNAYSSLERSLLITELIQGLELVKQLRSQMGPEYSAEFKDILIQQIESSYDKALFILGCGTGFTSEPPHQLLQVASTPLPGIEVSRIDDLNAALGTHLDAKEHSNKRKAASKWTKQIQVNCSSTHLGPPVDGYSWRKYGQKQILGAKNPRSYYRCTYRNVQDCCARKHIQRSDNDPNVLNITYKGNHTCSMARQSKSAPTTPGKQELATSSDNLPLTQYEEDKMCYFNGDISPSSFSFTNSFCEPFYSSSSLFSPTTSGSNCFSMSPCKMDTIASVQQNQQQSFQGNITDPDFLEFHPQFPFNNL